jgi:hypothetical protein
MWVDSNYDTRLQNQVTGSPTAPLYLYVHAKGRHRQLVAEIKAVELEGQVRLARTECLCHKSKFPAHLLMIQDHPHLCVFSDSS